MQARYLDFTSRRIQPSSDRQIRAAVYAIKDVLKTLPAFQGEVITMTVMWVAGIEQRATFDIRAFVSANVDLYTHRVELDIPEITAMKSQWNTFFQGAVPSQRNQSHLLL
ncbi:hypothetical protein BKA93DRAFT_747817 [Sparassis latifolia]